MTTRNLLRIVLLSSCSIGAGLCIPAACEAQQLKSLLTPQPTPDRTIDSDETRRIPSLEFGELEQTAEEKLPSENQVSPLADLDKTDTEVVRERFKEGRVHIERHVALDSNGNFVNHGDYEEWNQSGDVVCSGTFNMGQRQGPWIRFHQPKESKLFGTQPYTRFKAPFQSSVEFEKGKMNGVWVIVDAEKRVVSQIQLTAGIRHGQSAWFYPNGQFMFQADYSNGILNGAFIEKSAEGKVIREELYVDGQRSEVVKEHFANKAIKSEINFLTAPQRVLTQDDWETVTLATYSTAGERLRHGQYVVFHENGQMKLRGAYERGVEVGAFESWHANGEKAVSGIYENGRQQGKWSWWHPNGMRQSIANFEHGQVTDEVLAWNEQGKRVVAEQPGEQSPAALESRAAVRPVKATLVR